MAIIISSYGTSNRNYDNPISGSGTSTSNGQSFTSLDGECIIEYAKFYLKKMGSISGNAYAKIYAHTGTYGTSSLPTGTALATSDAFDVSVLTTTSTLYTFNFSGSNRIILAPSTYYVIQLEFSGGDGSNFIQNAFHNPAGTATGNGNYDKTTTTADEMIFYVYGNYAIQPSVSSFTLTGNNTNFNLVEKINYVGGYTSTQVGTASGTFNVSLTSLSGGLASSPSKNDLVIVSVASGSTADRDLGVTTSGYTEIADLYSDDTYDTNLSVNYKIMGSTPDTSVDVTVSQNTSDALTVTISVWRGVDTTNSLDVTPTTSTGNNTGRPTPPAITPTTENAKIVCIGAGAYSTTADFTTTDLSNFITTTRSDTNDSVIGQGSYKWFSGTFTPAVWGGNTTSTSASWCAVTIAMKPKTQQIISFVVDNVSFTLTGINNIFNWGRKMVADVVSFTLTGISSLLNKGYNIATLTGSFILNTTDIILHLGGNIIFSGQSGNFILTSIETNLSVGYKFITEKSQFILNGIDNLLKKGLNITTSVGDFTLTGIDNAFIKSLKVILDVGNFIVAGYGIMFKGQGSWKFKNIVKHASIWIDGIKHSSTFSNSTKNNSTFTNQNKNQVSINNIDKNSSGWINEDKS